jgi:hypothetical protein
MSKMHSANNTRHGEQGNKLHTTGVVAALAAAVLLGSCSRVDVHSNRVRGIAYVRIDEVIKHDPLYPQLQQLQDAISAINFESTLPHAPLTPAQIAAQTKQLNVELQQAQTRANSVIAAKQQQYGTQERAADAAALKAAGINPAAAGLGAQMNATSQAQAQAAAQAAQQGYMNYQRSVIAQDNAALGAIAQQLSKQADQKYRARAAQYAQAESDLSLQLEQQDSAQRIDLRTKLNTVALDPTQRKSIEDQLSAMDQKEASQVAALHAQHQQALAAYQKQLQTQTAASVHQQQSSIQAQTTAKLSQRRDQVGQQIQGLGGAPAPTVSIPPDVQRKLAQIHQQYAARFQADAQQAVEEYNQTKDDLDKQFEALHGQDVGATGAAAAQQRALQKRYDDLQRRIEDQVQSEAVRLAKEMGFETVLDNIAAANGGYDLTNDLIHDIESQHE